jgi:hypothetical protein
VILLPFCRDVRFFAASNGCTLQRNDFIQWITLNFTNDWTNSTRYLTLPLKYRHIPAMSRRQTGRKRKLFDSLDWISVMLTLSMCLMRIRIEGSWARKQPVMIRKDSAHFRLPFVARVKTSIARIEYRIGSLHRRNILVSGFFAWPPLRLSSYRCIGRA